MPLAFTDRPIAARFWFEFGRSVDRLPRLVFSRKTQIAIDAAMSTAAIWLAYQLRFDFSVPVDHRATMWTWVTLLTLLRPLCLWAWGVYKGTWRYFDFRDARAYAVGAMLPTALMLVLRIGSADVFAIKVPLTVIVADY